MFPRFLLFTLAASLAAPCLAQSTAPATANVPLVYSTTPMTRNADLMLSASIISVTATEAGLANISPSLFRSANWKARTVRAVKLALFDVPVVTYFAGLNHEWGHLTRATEFNVESQLSFVGSPWSFKAFTLQSLSEIPAHRLAMASIHGGGLAAARVLKDRAEMRMLGAERVPAGHALPAVIPGLDEWLYATHNLSPGNFADPETLSRLQGDVSTFVKDLVFRRSGPGASLDTTRGRVRARSALNLLDAALWSEAAGILEDYVWKGEPDVRIRWAGIGGVHLLPSLRYELSPYGPEYYVRSHYRVADFMGTGYGRWTEQIGIDRQVGGGLSIGVRSSPRVRPAISVDVWSQNVEGMGMRGELQADLARWPHERAALTVAVGAKSSGYLLGFPLDRGA